jgi:hypothetical protein
MRRQGLLLRRQSRLFGPQQIPCHAEDAGLWRMKHSRSLLAALATGFFLRSAEILLPAIFR